MLTYSDMDEAPFCHGTLVDICGMYYVVVPGHCLLAGKSFVVANARAAVIKQEFVPLFVTDDVALIHFRERISPSLTIQSVNIPRASDAQILTPGKRFTIYTFDDRPGKHVIRRFRLETTDSRKLASLDLHYRQENQISAIEISLSGELHEGASGSAVVGITGTRRVIYGFFTAKIKRNYVSFSDMVAYSEFVHAAARHLPQLEDGAIRKLRRSGTSFVFDA
ncbi:unnamed protein product [Soboliphyme baturini]|uniref:DUF4915 domain-containing protein n=1 Tax=Soboliphyme baturini TaxID=241478 RepID=A0A183IPB1_9BILA|nr:unnamed protein product [Soboliphyme baturini]